MADWYGATRSNYFRVTDPAAFATAVEDYPLELITSDTDPYLLCFLSDEEHGGIPCRYNEETGEEEGSLFDIIIQHLDERQVCVVMSSGAEKMRYITGQAWAISWDGQIISISLQEIYSRAKEILGDNVQITDCEY